MKKMTQKMTDLSTFANGDHNVLFWHTVVQTAIVKKKLLTMCKGRHSRYKTGAANDGLSVSYLEHHLLRNLDLLSNIRYMN